MHHGAEIDSDVSGDLRTVMLGFSHLGIKLGRANDRFRRHTADVQAIAAEQFALDQRDFRTKCRRGMRGHESGRSGTDDQELVAIERRWIDPIGWPHIFKAFSIEIVVRFECGYDAA